MTVSTTINKVTYVGDGTASAMPVTFPFFQPTDLIVTERVIATGTETQKVPDTHFTVAGGGGTTGAITPLASVPATVQWVISRSVPQTQEIDYVENDPFPADTHEEGLDRAALRVIDLQGQVTRAPKFPVSDPATAVADFPSSIARSNRIAAWDADGKPTVSTKTLAEVETDLESAVAAATAAAGSSEVNAAASASAAAASAGGAATSAAGAASSAAAASASNVAASNSAALAQAAAAGVRWKDRAKAASIADIVLSGEQTIDGVALVAGERCLVKNQTNPVENGMYVVAAGAWSRASDFDAWDELVSAAATVEQGTTNGDLTFLCISDSGGTLGATAVTFINFGGGDLVSTNNLSDVPDKAAARANLGAVDANDLLKASMGASPIGAVLDYAGTAAPSGWLLCYGQAVSRTTYALLFAALGTTHGIGDGSTTFNVPDLRGRVVAGQDDMGGASANRLTSPINGDTLGAAGGSESHTLIQAELPSHTHGAGSLSAASGGAHTHGYEVSTNGSDTPGLKADKVTQDTTAQNATASTNSAGAHTHTISGASDATGSGGAHNNVQPTLILNKIIFAGV